MMSLPFIRKYPLISDSYTRNLLVSLRKAKARSTRAKPETEHGTNEIIFNTRITVDTGL